MNKELAGKIRFWYIERRIYFCNVQNTYYIERERFDYILKPRNVL